MNNRELSAAAGLEKSDLVLKNASVINVFTESIEHGDVAVYNGKIVGVGKYEGMKEIDCSGKYIAPGFIDGHIHLESSMMTLTEFTKTVLPHGTTAVIADPHEIANVCGVDGINYMMDAAKELLLDFFFVLPSCVPSTPFDESGCSLLAKDLRHFYDDPRILGLGEVMDYPGAIKGDKEILQKIQDAEAAHKIIDGHAPGFARNELCAYVTAGVQSDHECTNITEAKEKLSRGQWLMVREGTAAQNLDALMELFQPPYHQRTLLVTDDKHPYDLLHYGHMDHIIRKAVKNGADPIIAIKMATLNAASYFGLKARGAIAPGHIADFVILTDLNSISIDQVYKNGILVAGNDYLIDIKEANVSDRINSRIQNSFHCRELSPEDFQIASDKIHAEAEYYRVIHLIKGEILTKEERLLLKDRNPEISVENDILKLAVIERHHDTNHIGIGFVRGYGLKNGAIASSVSHDSHNLIVIGTNDTDMAAAANCIRAMRGGWAIAREGRILEQLPLPIGGLMSELDAVSLSAKIEEMKNIAKGSGVAEGIDPFMSLAFISLPVIPELRLTTTGLIDVGKQCHVPLCF